MTQKNSKKFSRLVLALFFVCSLVFIAACSPAANGGSQPEVEERQEEMDHEDHSQHNEADHGHNEMDGRIPNEGAAIRIVSPADGATFPAGAQIVVEIETENFDLGEEGNHWHVYVDGSSWGMVMGANTDEVLTGIEPGEHELSVYLSIGSHEELEEGDSITITVEE